jgi:hypothetical protein
MVFSLYFEKRILETTGVYMKEDENERVKVG